MIPLHIIKPRGIRLTSVVLVTILLVLSLLQLNHLLYPSTAVQTTKPEGELQEISSKGSSYYDSDGLKIVMAKPGDKDAEDSYIAEALSSDKIDVHMIQDYSDEEYYTNKEYGSYQDVDKLDKELTRDSSFKNFINGLMESIQNAKPDLPTINNKKHYNATNKFPMSWDNKIPVLDGKLRENNGRDPIRSKDYLRSFFQLSEDEVTKMKESHKKMMDSLPAKFPDDVESEISGRGILYAGGGTYNWLVLLSLKMLRDTGSKLPVEVFIPTDSEFSADLCNRVFPVFGAKCILMENYIDVKTYRFKGYQLKSMALLLTSFEDVLMLDSDNIPLKNPDVLFINEPYKSNGLVVWPDFWRRSTSPTFYEIADIFVNETKQVRYSYGDERDHPTPLATHEDYEHKVSYHDLEGTFPEASAETGQLLINKKTHAKAIFLSLYYNFFGPTHYYPLFSQGQAGEGDKETILAAAHKVGLPYYQVQEYIREYGELTGENEFHISAMGQYDPILDYVQSVDPVKNKDPNWDYDRSKNNYLMHKYKKSETLFLHCNQPKLYPWKVDGRGFRQIHDGDGNRRRLYSDVLVKELGFDAEAKIWESMEWLLCKHGDMNIKGMREPEKWCGRVQEQLAFLRGEVKESTENNGDEQKKDD
jgi:alpha 1,2-mannosyltransferase